MRLGIGSYAFAWAIGVPGHEPARRMTVFDLLDEAHRLGVQVVQLCDNLPLTELSMGDLDRFEQQVQRLGIAVELGTRGLDPKTLRSYLSLCTRFGSPILRLVVDSAGDEPSAQATVKRLQPFIKECARANVQLAIENHDRFSSATLAWVIEQLGHEHAGICLDTVNSFGALEGPEVVVRSLGHLVLCVHVKDFTLRRVSHNMGFVVEGCAAGQGRLDVSWLLQAVRPKAAFANAILETWVSPSNSLEETIARERQWAELGIRYLRTLIPE